MNLDDVSKLWTEYRNAPVSQVFHPNDEMRTKGQSWYFPVGESAVSVISAALAAAPTLKINSAADFGCGYGRVSRHLRAYLPRARLYYLDIDIAATEFCATEFGGIAMPSSENLSDVKLPNQLDLIWVGSVFTHLDHPQMQILFERLFESLAPNGALMITTHGSRCIEMAKQYPYISAEKWQKIVTSYNETGFGYERYADPNLPAEWGVSLISPGRVWDLGRKPSSRLVFYKEAGWADHQDVVAWTRLD